MQPTKKQITAFHSKGNTEKKIEYLCQIFEDPTEYLVIEKEIEGDKFGIEVTSWSDWADNLNYATKQIGKKIFVKWKDAFEADLLSVSNTGPVILYEMNKLLNSPLNRNLTDYGKDPLSIYDGEGPYLLGEMNEKSVFEMLDLYGSLKINSEGVAVFEKLKYLDDLQKNGGKAPAVEQTEKVDYVDRYLSAFEIKYKWERDKCAHAKKVLRRFFDGAEQVGIKSLSTPAGSFEVLCTMLYQIHKLEQRTESLSTEFISLISQLFSDIKAKSEKFRKSATRGRTFLQEKLGIGS